MNPEVIMGGYTSREAESACRPLFFPSTVSRRPDFVEGFFPTPPKGKKRPSLNISDAGELFESDGQIRKHTFKYTDDRDEAGSGSEAIESEGFDGGSDDEWELVASGEGAPASASRSAAPQEDPDEWAFVSTDDKKPPFMQALLKGTVNFTPPVVTSKPSSAVAKPTNARSKASPESPSGDSTGFADDAYWGEKKVSGHPYRGRSSKSKRR